MRVFVNSEEIAKTDANGMLVLPTLTSFVDNQISINTANVPLEFSFPESMKVVSPPYRGGAAIDFHAKRLQAVTGAIKIKSSEGVRPAQFLQVTVAVDGRPFSFPGRGGESYVEDLKPGRYSARMIGNGQCCKFELDVPEASEAFTQLPDIVCPSMR